MGLPGSLSEGTILPRPIMNACGHDHHVRHDVHDRVFLSCQHEHVREHGHGRVHGCEPSQSREYAGGYAGADVRVNLS